MPVYPVLLDVWQQQCCGDDFRVGDTVSWQLQALVPSADYSYPEERLVELAAPPDGNVVQHGRLVVYILPQSTTPIRAVLHEDHHEGIPDEVAATTGTVERIRVVPRRYKVRRAAGGKAYSRTEQLTDARGVPDAFQQRRDGNVLVREDNLLVDLRV